MMTSPTGKLTTHVLDTAIGRPAAGMVIELWRMDEVAAQHIATQTTNKDGRTDSPFLIADGMTAGVYELRFGAGDYFAKNFAKNEASSGANAGATLPTPPFLDVVPIRFGIADVNAHYHVPLLVSPWSYSTYRGS